jgi:large subunit ribosomal protein L9
LHALSPPGPEREAPGGNIGEYDIVVKLHADVQTTVKVVVQAEA